MLSKQNGSSKSKGNANLRVVVRLRPPNEEEDSEKYRTVTHAVSDHMLVFDPKVQVVPGVVQAKPRSITSHRFKDLKYAFDHVFGPRATNRDVFEHATKGIVSGVLNGYNCSVFAYGATGAGKTHTMLGSECEPGVIYFTMMDLYKQIEERKNDKTFDVAISYSEVYNEQVRDLLVPRGSLPIREDKTVGVIIAGLSLHKPKTAEELLHMLHFGNKNRTQHPTDANAESSRSHAVFQVFVNQRDKLANMGSELVMAKMCLVDLAGSERAHCTTNCGARFREGANINRSLLALGNVINALADNKFKGHIPYRDSKLTRLLKDSLGGNCRTVMIAAVSPSSRSFEDTYNTLRYADRAKHIRADIKKNVMSVDFHITNYKKYVQDLEKQNQELRKTKQHLLECLEKGDTGSSQGISPILRQLQERLKDLFKVRRDLCKKQMDCEGAKRELKWKVSRREQAIKRVQHLTQASTVLKKHHGVIERMKKRIEKEEQSLQQSTLRIHDQDNLIRKAVAEFTVTDRKQAPELLDLNVRTYVLESNLHDTEMYLAFVKKFARAQERQASATESLVTSLLQLVKRQHDVLHSQDLLSPELQQKYEKCCYLVEERGVAFSQPSVPSPLHQQSVQGPAREDCGDVRVSPSYAAAVATKGEREDHLNISDIIDIRIPRLRAQEVIHCVAEVRPQAPQRVLKPISAVRPAARINSTQEDNMPNSTGPNLPSPFYQHSLAQTSTNLSDQCQDGSPSTVTAPDNPTEQLHVHLSSCPRQGERNGTTNQQSHSSNKVETSEASRLCGNIDALAMANPQNPVTHHQFLTCASASTSGTLQNGPPATQQQSPVSADVSSSTDNLNNTFQVLQPTLPNTPCISSSPHKSDQEHQLTPQCTTPSALPSSTPRGKRIGPCILQHRLSFQEGHRVGKNQPHGQSLLAQGDGRNLDRHQLQQLHMTRLNANNGNSNASMEQIQNLSLDSVSRPSNSKFSYYPSSTPYKTVVKPANSDRANTPSTSPKSYAEAVKSPPIAQLVCVKTPESSKPPARVKASGHYKASELTTSMKTPDFNFSQFKRKLQLSCEKLPLRVAVEGVRSGEHSDSSGTRQPLQPLDTNNRQGNSSNADTKPLRFPNSPVGNQIPSKTSKHEASPHKSHKNTSLSSQGSLRLKAPFQQRYRRALGAAKPYSVQSPRRQRRWPAMKGNLEVSGDTVCTGRPSYMQPTFARAQKMLAQDTDKSSQRSTDNSAASKRTIIHKQRFVLA